MTGVPVLPAAPDADPMAVVGLTSAEAARRLRTDGPNSLPPPQRRHPARQLAGEMVHAFALMLWIAAALAVVAGMPTLAVAIVAVIVINGVFAFVQEYRADRAAERLGGMMPSAALARRDGVSTTVDTAALVVGDVVVLEAGDRVGADMAVLGDATLGIDASLLNRHQHHGSPRGRCSARRGPGGRRSGGGTGPTGGQAADRPGPAGSGPRGGHDRGRRQ